MYDFDRVESQLYSEIIINKLLQKITEKTNVKTYHHQFIQKTVKPELCSIGLILVHIV